MVHVLEVLEADMLYENLQKFKFSSEVYRRKMMIILLSKVKRRLLYITYSPVIFQHDSKHLASNQRFVRPFYPHIICMIYEMQNKSSKPN